MSVKIFTKDFGLALWIVGTLCNAFRANLIHVINVLPSRYLFMALLALQKYELTILFQMFSHLDLENVFEAKFTYFKAVWALFSMLRHAFPGNPRLTA